MSLPEVAHTANELRDAAANLHQLAPSLGRLLHDELFQGGRPPPIRYATIYAALGRLIAGLPYDRVEVERMARLVGEHTAPLDADALGGSGAAVVDVAALLRKSAEALERHAVAIDRDGERGERALHHHRYLANAHIRNVVLAGQVVGAQQLVMALACIVDLAPVPFPESLREQIEA